MKNKIAALKQTWTYQHKLLIVTLALAVAHIAPLIEVPPLFADTIEYTNPAAPSYKLENDIVQRTIRLYDENRQNDLERYRLEAISEINQELQDMVYLSPNIDYKELKAKYGY